MTLPRASAVTAYDCQVTEDTIPQAPRSKADGPRDVFLYLLNFLSLYISAIGLAVLSWGVIDRLVDDPARPSFGSEDTVRVGLSMVVVAFPVYIYLTMSIRKKFDNLEMSPGSLLRKILTYITLFVIAVTAVVDLISVVYVFLGGEMTMRFFLKAAIIFVMVSLVFAYHLIDLREAKST